MYSLKKLTNLSVVAVFTLLTAAASLANDRVNVLCIFDSKFTKKIKTELPAIPSQRCYTAPGVGPGVFCDPGLWLDAPTIFYSPIRTFGTPGSNDESPFVLMKGNIRVDPQAPLGQPDTFSIYVRPSKFMGDNDGLIPGTSLVQQAYAILDVNPVINVSYSKLLQEPFETELKYAWFSKKQNKVIARRGKLVCSR